MPTEEAHNPPQPEATRATPPDPLESLRTVRLGHYSDNNKTLAQIQSWHRAEDLFRKKQYAEAFDAFFDFLTDRQADNVEYVRGQDGAFTFRILQGSRVVIGACDGQAITASALLVKMPEPLTAVMRRLLDLNFKLYYCRCALDDEQRLAMRLDCPVTAAAPAKFFDALRELAINSDKHDDLLIADFPTLEPISTTNEEATPPGMLDIKHRFFNAWIDETLNLAAGLNPDAMAGAISYLLLALLYRIDFLLAPKSSMLRALERASQNYWNKKDELTLVARNRILTEDIQKLKALPRAEFDRCMVSLPATFAAGAPFAQDKARDNVNNGMNMANWCADNGFEQLSLQISEFGPAYNLYNYALPQTIVDLSRVWAAVMQSGYFKAIGLTEPLYDAASGTFHKERIEAAVNAALARLSEKYVQLSWDHAAIRYDNLLQFSFSFARQMAGLNLEQKRPNQITAL